MENPSSSDLGRAGALVVRALIQLAEDRSDVRDALDTLLRAVDGTGNGRAGALPEKVLTPRRATSEREGQPSRPPRQVDLSVVVRRARWKAAACRLAIDKRRNGADDVATLRLEDNLRKQRAELEDCWAWMLDPARPLAEDALLGDVAACYETVAQAADSALKLEEMGALVPKPPSELLYLLAESQSALLAALHKCELRGDSDQRDLFLWLKHQTTQHRIYVDRHMRLDDPADSTSSPRLNARLADLVSGADRKLRQVRVRAQLINKVRYHLQKATAAGGACEQDIHALESAAAEWMGAGLAVDDHEFSALVRELVGPDHAEELGPATTQIVTAQPDSTDGRAEAVRTARELLDGRFALVFGGQHLEEESKELVEALGLSNLRFVVLPEQDVEEILETEIQAPDSDLVLIASRLPQPQYAEFKRMCLEHDRPFVRLSSGVNPGHVAHQVLRQVAWRLRQPSPH